MGTELDKTFLFITYSGEEYEGGKPRHIPWRINWKVSPWKTWKKLAV